MMPNTDSEPIELSPRTRVVVQLGTVGAIIAVVIGAALWADDVSDSLASIDDRLRILGESVGTLDDASVRRSVLNAWIREYRAGAKGWAKEVNAKHPELDLPEIQVPDLPQR